MVKIFILFILFIFISNNTSIPCIRPPETTTTTTTTTSTATSAPQLEAEPSSGGSLAVAVGGCVCGLLLLGLGALGWLGLARRGEVGVFTAPPRPATGSSYDEDLDLSLQRGEAGAEASRGGGGEQGGGEDGEDHGDSEYVEDDGWNPV